MGSSGIDSWSSSCLLSTSSTFFCGVSKASLEDADSKLMAWGPSKLRSTGRTTRPWNKPKVTTRKKILKKDVNTWDLESARRMNANVVVIPPFKTAGPILVLEMKLWLESEKQEKLQNITMSRESFGLLMIRVPIEIDVQYEPSNPRKGRWQWWDCCKIPYQL